MKLVCLQNSFCFPFALEHIIHEAYGIGRNSGMSAPFLEYIVCGEIKVDISLQLFNRM